ncbi:hypothetical protein PR048_011466 [Dryococelus australis]|uniref:Uncharacterized protein n=1 Tax=Dryococelus australis TaxID=614101 RepID=A0ABQ9HLM3_9NEOP|nr:hypothetical protein PR048_011466 [Dryococelus australis]
MQHESGYGDPGPCITTQYKPVPHEPRCSAGCGGVCDVTCMSTGSLSCLPLDVWCLVFWSTDARGGSDSSLIGLLLPATRNVTPGGNWLAIWHGVPTKPQLPGTTYIDRNKWATRAAVLWVPPMCAIRYAFHNHLDSNLTPARALDVAAVAMMASLAGHAEKTAAQEVHSNDHPRACGNSNNTDTRYPFRPSTVDSTHAQKGLGPVILTTLLRLRNQTGKCIIPGSLEHLVLTTISTDLLQEEYVSFERAPPFPSGRQRRKSVHVCAGANIDCRHQGSGSSGLSTIVTTESLPPPKLCLLPITASPQLPTSVVLHSGQQAFIE